MNTLQIGDKILSSLITAHEYKNINLDILMSTGISKQWFVSNIQQDIFEVISVCYKAGKPFDEELIAEYLSKTDFKDPLNIIFNILAQKQTSQEILLEYIKKIKEEYRKRMLSELNAETTKMLNDPKCDPDMVTLLIQNTLNDYEFLNNQGHTKKLDDVRAERKAQPERERIKTNIPFIDTVLTKKGKVGLKPGSFMFISGLKESGKTFTLTRIIENVSKNHPVLFGSLEFGAEDYDENIEEQQEDGFFQGDTKNIFIFDDVYDVNKIIAEIRYQHKVNKIKLVALDSMLRITNNDPNHTTNEKKLSDMFSKIGKLAKELDIPIIMIVQSSKEDLKSSIVSVKGCMDADHEAFIWYHIYKSDTKNPDNEQRTVLWVKNKDTKKHPKQHLMFVPQTSDFYRIEVDKNGMPCGALDKYRKPKFNSAEPNYTHKEPEITTFESTQDTADVDMPDIFDF